jgi:hypothetical protein
MLIQGRSFKSIVTSCQLVLGPLKFMIFAQAAIHRRTFKSIVTSCQLVLGPLKLTMILAHVNSMGL